MIASLVKHLAILTIGALPAFAAESDLTLQTGILPVTTKFEPSRLETGTGFAVAATLDGRERFFVFTCAHLTGGEDTKLGDRPLSEAFLRRRTDSFHDIDLIEVKPVPGLRPFARLASDGTSLAVDPAALAAWTKNKQRTLDVEPKTKGAAFALVPSWSQGAAAEGAFPERVRQWSTSDLFTSSEKSRGLVYHVIGSTIGAPASIAPGMSCSPLIDRAAGQQIVRGMGSEFKNKMMGSTFASDRQLLRALKALIDGEIGQVNLTRWHSQNGLLYRTFAEGRAEIVPLGRPAGNGISTSPGNGISTSPGSSDAGTSCEAVSAQDLWKDIGSAPALRWDGQNLIGFLMRAYVESRAILISPNHAGIEFRLKAEPYAQFEGLPLGSPLMPFLDTRYGGTGPYTVKAPALGVLPGPRLERKNDGLTVTVFGDQGRERIVFQLNEFGALTDSREPKTFYPLIDVKGSKGHVYTVDLRGLFFSDVSDWATPVSNADESFDTLEKSFTDKAGRSADALLTVARGQQILQAIAPSIAYRRRCARDEYHFSFNRRIESAALPSKNQRKPANNRR